MRGEQHRNALVSDELKHFRAKLLARKRIESARRLVENEQARPVRKRKRKKKLYLHPLGQLRNFLSAVDSVPRKQVFKRPLVPIGIAKRHGARYRVRALLRIITEAAADIPYFFLDFALVPAQRFSEKFDRSLRSDRSRHRFQRRGLARAVRADQPRYAPFAHGKRHVFEHERRIPFG